MDSALAAAGFPYGRDRRTDALSGGELQRLALAGVLALEPGLLLLDEPTANLDPAGADLVRAAIGRVAAGRTLILIEHRVEAVVPLVDRVIALAPGGGLLADGRPEKVFAEYGDDLAARGVWVPGSVPVLRRATTAPGATVLSARGVGLRQILRDIDEDVREGEALAILGPNGAGKTTLALILGGLLAPDAGQVRAPAERRPPHRWPARVLARHIGSVFQNPEYQFLTGRVRAELALGGASPSTVDILLARLRLTHLADANPYTLSGGEQRRLSVATALAAAPRVLILDEPTFGQDRRTWAELVDILAGLRDEGRAVVTVTHDPDLVTALADRVRRL